MGGTIVGSWTHGRCDAGGARALRADVRRAKPRVAWTWQAPFGTHVDQIRIGANWLAVVSSPAITSDVAGWEHATITTFELTTGRLMAHRRIPDPAPIAAIVLHGDVVHILATRKGEPIFWYALGCDALRPLHRRRLDLGRDTSDDDILDAWVTPEGGLWLELESRVGERSFAFVDADQSVGGVQSQDDDVGVPGHPQRDACCDGEALFAPMAGCCAATNVPRFSKLWKGEPNDLPGPSSGGGVVSWNSAGKGHFDGRRESAHALVSEGSLHLVAVTEQPGDYGNAIVHAAAFDPTTGIIRSKSNPTRLPLKNPNSHGWSTSRVVRRPTGELLVQRVQSQPGAASDVLAVNGSGEIDVLSLGTSKRYVIDAALGDVVLAHHDARRGRVITAAFDVDRGMRLLGRRTEMLWSIETPDFGDATTLYAGNDHVAVRSSNGIAVLRMT